MSPKLFFRLITLASLLLVGRLPATPTISWLLGGNPVTPPAVGLIPASPAPGLVAILGGGSGSISVLGSNGYTASGSSNTAAGTITNPNSVYSFFTATAHPVGQADVQSTLVVRCCAPGTPFDTVIAGYATNITGTSCTLHWTATSGEFIANYEIANNGTTIGTTASLSYPLSGLTNGTTYTSYSVRGVSTYGEYTPWVTLPFMTLDTQAPGQPGAVSASGISVTGATVSWGAATDNVGVAGYKVTLLQAGIPIQTQTTTSLSLGYTWLAPSTAYTASVVAFDAAGNQSTAQTGNFSTTNDTVSAPTNLAATNITGGGCTLNWTASTTNVHIASYTIYLNSQPYCAVGASSPGTDAPTTIALTGLTNSTVYSVQVAALTNTGRLSPLSAALPLTTGSTGGSGGGNPMQLVPLGAVASPLIIGPEVIAAFGGSVSVDNHGSADYTIPLQIAPGRAGLQPRLALGYSSAAGNGIAGLGWSLSNGFPGSITRGRSILARDGVVRGVNFDANDKFYLDGKRLIYISGGTGYGTPGSIYRTEVDSFVTITTTGTGSNIETFTVTDKSGVAMTFGKSGGTTDAYQPGLLGVAPDTLAYSYALKKVQDTLGNTVLFTYQDLGGGEFVLSRIDYTGNGISTGNSHVELAYTVRPDQPVTYVATRAFNHRARLSWVFSKTTVNGGDRLAASYRLTYEDEQVGVPPASIPRRSRLVSVTSALADPQSPYNLCPCHPVTISWQNYVDQLASSSTSFTISNQSQGIGYNSQDIQWADTANNGKDQALSDWIVGTSVPTTIHNIMCDVDGDGAKDQATVTVTVQGPTSASIGITVTRAAGGTATFTTAGAAAFQQYFADVDVNGNPLATRYVLAIEGAGVSSRITVADFTGDGRDDIMVVGFDGHIHLFVSNGTSFADPQTSSSDVDGNHLHSPFVGGQVSDPQSELINGKSPIALYFGGHTFVKPMPCELNGDGITDYVCANYSRALTRDGNGNVVGYTSMRFYRGVTANGDGTFSSPFAVAQGPIEVIASQPDNSVRLNDVNSGAMPGDFNGDGLTDFLVLVPPDDLSTYGGYFGAHRWALYLNQGCGPGGVPGAPIFKQYNGVIPDTVTLPTNQTVNTYYCATLSSPGHLGWLNGVTLLYQAEDPNIMGFFAALESATGTINTNTWDVNHDGIADLVWYVAVDQNEAAVSTASQGWWAMLSTGNFTTNGTTSTGFTGPVKLDYLSAVGGGSLSNGNTPFHSTRINHSLDTNGDGLPDFFIEDTLNGRPYGGTLYLNTGSFGDLVSAVTDGIGSSTSIAYKAAKDGSLYTKGATVSYPIRELPASTPVVSDIWRDSGGATPAQFSYQYSGNMLDLSGRGGLGFHSFVTLDRQTNLFKYQFLAQSFPMTGLAVREQTYRYWDDGQARFRAISSHDNTVVFDKVSTYGTLYPFISKAIESRWEDSATPHYTLSLTGLLSQPELLFTSYVTSPPANPHITITATSLFDGQSTPQLTLPGVSGYQPSDTNSGGVNVVSGTLNGDPTVVGSTFIGLPGAITYGNLAQLFTDYNGFTETVNTTYKTPVGPLTGLVDTIKSTVVSPVGGTEVAPIKSYTYSVISSVQTPLVASEKIDAAASGVTNPNSNLTATTTYTRDNLGRVTVTNLAGTDLQSVGQGAVNYTVSNNTNFDARWDLPTTTLNNYGHTTTTAYQSFLGLPTSVTRVNGDQYTTQYDALGRTLQVFDVNKGLQTNTGYASDAATQSVAGPSGFNGVASGAPITGVSGLTLTSAYKVTTTTTVKPTVTAYYDRLGRVIRTITDGFNGQQVVTDTAYNTLGQTIATSLPYLSGNTPLWAKTTYDALGRVVTVTAPNGTVTTNTYIGRATKVSVDAPNLGGVDPAAQVNTTLVDAKGRTVKVWNADNEPTFSDNVGTTTTAASIAFALDGFGRMRTTTLLGQAATITATYDTLGRQLTLSDPDKGNWSYVNNALGQVLIQTDARSNVTSSTFDRLGRPLSRVTTGNSSTETATFYYYDADNTKPNTVAKGSQGWIGSPEREECTATGSYATTNLHYYDAKGRPALELAQTDGKWFYTYSDYDAYSRIRQTRHYWKPSGAEAPGTQPYLWQDFGYTYTYDGSGASSKSYLIALTDTLGRTWWDQPSYDYLDRVTSVRKGGSLVTTRTYRPEDGVVTAIQTGNATIGAAAVQNLSFNFDGLCNLRSRSDAGVSGGSPENFGYDNLSRLTGAGNTGTVGYLANGNIQTKNDVNLVAGGTYTYDSVHPHAVASAFGYAMTYDANGNLLTHSKTGDVSTVKWAGFDKPRWMAKTSLALSATAQAAVGSEFHYNAARSRVMQLEFNEATSSGPTKYNRKRLYALGSTLELNYTTVTPALSPAWDLDTVRIYVPGPDGIIGAREFRPASGGMEKTLVYHYDHLGSITAITDYGSTAATYSVAIGNKSGRYSEDAWGQRRDPLDWIGAPTSATDDGGFDSLTPRGFTSHEMLDDLGLVHMNGRIYDPLLGRFLSADLLVQSPGDLQSYNRYSYCMNNPLRFTDPTGFTAEDEAKKKVEEAWKSLAKQGIVGIVIKNGEVVGVVVKQAANQAQPNGSTPHADRGPTSEITPKGDGGEMSSKPPSTEVSSAAAVSSNSVAKDATKVGGQVAADVANGTQDTVVGTINILGWALRFNALPPAGQAMQNGDPGFTPLPSPDWSKNLVVEEGDTLHERNRLIGGIVGGLIMGRPGGAAPRIGATGQIGEDALKVLGGEAHAYFKTSLGRRFVDRLARGVIHESKVGYQTLTKEIQLQIAKDVEIVGSGRVQEAAWHFFRSPVTGAIGPSEPLLQALQQAGIKVIFVP